MSGRLKVWNGSAWDYVGGGSVGSGSSFPVSPSTNDRYYRTDLGETFFYDGTRWRCTINHETGIPNAQRATGLPMSATVAANGLAHVPDLAGGSDIWIIRARMTFQVASGGTALGASHKWVATITKGVDGATTEDSLTTFNVDSGSSAAWRTIDNTIGALMNNGTTHRVFIMAFTKTGTPGNLYAEGSVTWNHVAT